MMYIIYSFSAQDGTESASISGGVSNEIVAIANNVFDLGFNDEQIEYYSERIHHYVRKLGHVTEYFLLAVSVSFPLYVYGIRGIWLMLVAGLICVGYAGLDEYHQTFVAGRGPSLRDVGIDSIGIFFGIILTRIVGWTGRMTIFRPLSRKKRTK